MRWVCGYCAAELSLSPSGDKRKEAEREQEKSQLAPSSPSACAAPLQPRLSPAPLCARLRTGAAMSRRSCTPGGAVLRPDAEEQAGCAPRLNETHKPGRACAGPWAVRLPLSR